MILAPKLYSSVYLTVVVILTLICMFRYSTYPSSRVADCNKPTNPLPALALTVLVWLFIGFRPISGVFVDMMNYFQTYEMQANNDFEFDNEATNFLFDNLLGYLASNLYDVIIFFALIAAIYFGCMYWGLKKIFPNDIFYALVIYLGAFSTFAFGTNGIKAGAAASIFILVFAFYKKPIIAIIFALISLGFHHSMFIPIYAVILAYFIKNPKWFFWGWILCLIISSFHIQGITEFLSQLTEDEKAEGYLLGDEEGWGGKEGFRWDFILYGLPPILVGFWTVYIKGLKDRLYHLLLCTYLTTNGVWLLCMYIPFNNRIAYLSWFILPIVCVYPFFKLKLGLGQYKQLNGIVAVYLVFTLLAHFFL